MKRTIQRKSFSQYNQLCDSGSNKKGKKCAHLFVSHMIYTEKNVGNPFCTISS